MFQANDPKNAFSAANPFAAFLGGGQDWLQQCASVLDRMAGGQGIAPEAFDSAEMAALRQKAMLEHMRLWSEMLGKGQQAISGFFAAPGDRRFAAPEWRDSPVFAYFQQTWALNNRFIAELAELLPAESAQLRERMRFYARQIGDAMAPTNFAATNPEFIREALATEGKSIVDGIANLIGDYQKGRISMTDESAFELGRNIAATPGAVVFENEVMQLIQYAPLTPTVNKRPVLVIPPCINKFYIMDLQPDNSLIRFMIEQGNTVFLVSWRNPGEAQGHLGWDDYIAGGPIAALETVRAICRNAPVNAVGFCVGGTMLASALAVLAARGKDWVASLTLLTTLLDFSDTGEIGLFVDESSVRQREESIGKGGVLPARDLQNTFSFLRANDLVWNYVTNNYLMGKKPAAFDLLYWNSDSTNLPGPFAAWYLRNMYHENNLCVPGRLTICGEQIDLGRLRMPTYLFAAREDHIVPWRSAYRSTRLLGGDCRFVLGASGHIAGVINPAAKNRRSFWINADTGGEADTWLEKADELPGSWWRDWANWFAAHGGGVREAPKKPGNKKFLPIEPAPGRYVKERVI